MIKSINYSISANDVLNNPEFSARLRWMSEAGVDTLWFSGFHYGHYDSDAELVYRAKRRLEDMGFGTGVISLPVGHPGNSLNPDDPDIQLSISRDWRYRVDCNGENVYYCSCIEDKMLADNVEAARMYAQIGFTRHFYDDDLRLSNLDDTAHGCFCDDCIAKFNALTGMTFSREQLKAACLGAVGMEDVRAAWEQFNCDKLTRFMEATCIPGMTSGIMVMFTGGRRHGISIPDIRRAVPGCLFRVGEYHFDEAKYTAPGGKAALAQSVRDHLALIGDNPAYSESTVFPAAALSPENLIDKIKLELSLGLRNIYLMSGTWFMSEPYWKAVADALPELRELAAD